jgi:hypothetical protein
MSTFVEITKEAFEALASEDDLVIVPEYVEGANKIYKSKGVVLMVMERFYSSYGMTEPQYFIQGLTHSARSYHDKSNKL